MNMLRNLSFRNYWSMHPIIHTPYTSVGMSREKFLALLAMFHLNNNDAKVARRQPRYDLRSTIQIRPDIDTLITNFRTSTHRKNS
jgi:hypothetical protein